MPKHIKTSLFQYILQNVCQGHNPAFFVLTTSKERHLLVYLKGGVLRQGEQSPVVIIFYEGYSSPKCTCNGRTTHLSKTCKFLLKCLYVMDENLTHPYPHLEPSLTPSRMPNPNVSKTSFSKQKLVVPENLL